MGTSRGIGTLLLSLNRSEKDREKAPIVFKAITDLLLECLEDCENVNKFGQFEDMAEQYKKILELNIDRYRPVLDKSIITLITAEASNPSQLSNRLSISTDENAKKYLINYVKGEYNSLIGKYVAEERDIDLISILKAYKTPRKTIDLSDMDEDELNIIDEPVDNEFNSELEEVVEPTVVEEVVDSETDIQETSNDETNLDNSEENNTLDIEAIKEVWEDTVYQEVQRILEIYQNLFKSGMEVDKPVGILVSDGYRAYVKGRGIGRKANPIFGKLYNVVAQILGNENLNMPQKSKTISLDNVMEGYNYFVDLQVRNLFGVCSVKDSSGSVSDYMCSNWFEFESKIEKVLENIIYQAIVELGTDNIDEIDNMLSKLRTALTTCIAITEYDKATCIKLRIYANGKQIDSQLIEHEIKKGKLFSGKGKVKLFTETDGVYTIAVIFDEVANSQRPLFAFQAINTLIERNEKLSWKNVVLGRDIDTDTIYTMDFTNNALFNCIIGAGQRSGKGVMTLNILGAAFAEKFPIFYADGKPEMGRMLWKLGEKYGIPVFAIDCMEAHPKYVDLVGKGLPSGLGSKKAVALTIAYIKMLQLSVVFANTRNLGVNFDVPGFDSVRDRAVFVFDEALAFRGAIMNTRKAIKTADSILDSKEDKEMKRVYKGLLGWIDTANLDFRSSLMSQMPKSAINLFWLNQNMTGEWKVEDNDFASNAVRSSSTCRILGSGMIGQYFGLPNTPKLANYVNMTERCFGFYTGLNRPEDDSGVKLFKPYLVLPSSEIGDESNCVEQLENNTPEKILRSIRLQDGTYREDIGFEGIIKLISNGDPNVITQALRKSYDIAHKLLSMAGLLDKYNAPYDEIVYHYMYDCDPSTLMATGDIVEAIRLGGISKLSGNSLDMAIDSDSEEPTETFNDTQTQEIDYSELYNQQEEPEETYFELGKDTVKVEEVREVVDDRDPFGNIKHSNETYQASQYVDKRVDNIREDLQSEINKVSNSIDSMIVDEQTREEFRKQLSNILNNVFVVPPNSRYDERGRNVYEGSDAEILNKGNSIDCSEAVRLQISWMDKALNKSPQGCLLYINKLWKVILDEACNQEHGGIRRELVAKVGLYGGNLYINGRIVNLNGILGGSNGVELVNIVNFPILFKKFQGMTELQIDDEMMQALLSDCDGVGDIKAPFSMCPRLRVIQYLTDGRVHAIKRQETLTKETGEALSRRRKAAQIERMNYMSNRQNIVTSWKETTDGKKIWGASQARKLLSSSASNLEKKDGKRKYVKGVAYGGLALATGILGGSAYFLYNGTKAIRRYWKGYQ